MRKIIFDLDDTLYNSRALRAEREKAILEFLGDRKKEYLNLKKNNGTIKTFELMGIEKKKFFEIMDRVLIELEKDFKLIELFQNLKNKFKIIILSNNSYKTVRCTLEKLGINEFVDEFYSSEKIGFFKPSEECFFMINKGDICVGNNFEKDLKIPKKIGALTILLGNSCDADFNIYSIYELKELLDKF